MNKPKKKMIGICAALFLGVVVAWFIYALLHPLPREYYIFQDIDECENLIPSDQADAHIDRYDTPDQDKSLKGLPYDRFFGMSFESSSLEYEIFAYEFEDADSALKYFVNVTGQNYEERLPLDEEDENILLSASSGMLQYQVVVVCRNRAYLLTAPNRYADEINELLGNTFSQEIS